MNIVDKIEELFIKENLEYKRPEEFVIKANSPFVNDSKYRCSFTYKKENNVVLWRDFIAQGKLSEEDYKGTFYDFLKIYYEFSSRNEAKMWFLKNYLGIKGLKNKTVEKVTKSTVEKKIPFPFEPFEFYSKKHEPYYEYLKKRNVTDDRIKSLRIFVDTKSKRIVFPIYYDGKLISYQARSIKKKALMPWLRSEKIFEETGLWNIETKSPVLYIFEGIFDAIHLNGGVALMTNKIVGNQLEQIKNKNPMSVYVILDNDKAGKLGRIYTANELSKHLDNVYVFDWSKFSSKDFGELAEKGRLSKIIKNINKFSHKWGFESKIRMKTGDIT